MKIAALVLLAACSKSGASVGAPCALNTDCDSALACLEQKCSTVQCSTRDDCPEGQTCNSTRQCVAEFVAPTGPSAPTMAEPLMVTVTVLAHPYARPVDGAVVMVNGIAASTINGIATLPVASTPYDLTVLLAAQTYPTLGQLKPPMILTLAGLTRTDPLVHMYDAASVAHDEITGSLSSTPDTIPPGLGIYWYESAQAYAFMRQQFDSAQATQSVVTEVYRLPSISAPSGTFHALTRSDAQPHTFFYGTKQLALGATPGTGAVTGVPMAPVGTSGMTCSVVLPGSAWGVDEQTLLGSFGHRRIDIFHENAPGVSFTEVLPIVPGLQTFLRVQVSAQTEQRQVQALLTGGGSAQITFPIGPATLQAPAAMATVVEGTTFSWSAVNQATHVLYAKLGTSGPHFTCITKATSCTLPDTRGRGVAWSLPRGAEGTWKVTSTVPGATVDAITTNDLDKNDTLADTALFDSVVDADASGSAERPFLLP